MFTRISIEAAADPQHWLYGAYDYWIFILLLFRATEDHLGSVLEHEFQATILCKYRSWCFPVFHSIIKETILLKKFFYVFRIKSVGIDGILRLLRFLITINNCPFTFIQFFFLFQIRRTSWYTGLNCWMLTLQRPCYIQTTQVQVPVPVVLSNSNKNTTIITW